MDLPELLCRYRLAHDLTWAALASRLGLTASGVWKIAHRKATPTERTASRIRRRIGWWADEIANPKS